MAVRGARFFLSAALLVAAASCRDQPLTLLTPAPTLLTPPLGWRSGNPFGCTLDERGVQAIAEALDSDGMAAAGYRTITLDCWQAPRAAGGPLAADPARFPGGMAALADWLHQRGFKLGLSLRASAMCGDAASSRSREDEDARAVADWAVDAIAYDDCDPNLAAQSDRHVAYQAMATALARNRRAITFAITAPRFSQWMSSVAQIWHVGPSTEATPTASGPQDPFHRSFAAFAHVGSWQDAGGIAPPGADPGADALRAQAAFWSVLASPLVVVGVDVAQLPPEAIAALTNPDLLAIDQDSAGMIGIPIGARETATAFWRPLATAGQRAVALNNPTDTTATVTATWHDIGLASGGGAVRDLLNRTDLGAFTDRFETVVPPHRTVLVRVDGAEPAAPRGAVYLSDLTWIYAANFYGPVERDTSNNTNAAGDGNPLRIGGQTFSKGLGLHAGSDVRFYLGRACTRLQAVVGPDDEKPNPAVIFRVLADGEVLFESPILGMGVSKLVDVDLTGRDQLRLVVLSGAENELDDFENDHADWADARLTCRP